MNATSHHGDTSTDDAENSAPGRLIDEIIRFVRQRQGEAAKEGKKPTDDERLIRALVQQLRRHPLPTTLLGASALWLLLAQNEEDEEQPPLSRQIEDEVVGQLKGGFDYTSERLRELADRYPWAAGAVLVTGGLGAAFLLPLLKRQSPGSRKRSEPGGEEKFPGIEI